jgi:glycerol-3-phosphate dehydrogenase (NAD(P)+)
VTRAAVLGAGSWGTAFAKVMADAGTDVRLWARRPELAKEIQATRRNPDYLPDIELPAGIEATGEAAEALAGAELVVIAVPSQTLRANLEAWTPELPDGSLLVSLMKGVELGTTQRMSEVIRDVTGVPQERVAVVTGPNLAGEIAEQQPAAAVVASVDPARAEQLQVACTTNYFRPYTNTDVIGCELGGAVKNVIALACGMAEGMGFGDNTRASLITRGLAETTRLGLALGADPMTFAGLAGLGDLVATCISPLSRNRTVGWKLGRRMTLDQVLADTRQTAEGVKSCRSILDLAGKQGVDMPITEHVVMVCQDGMRPTDMVARLMGRETKPE